MNRWSAFAIWTGLLALIALLVSGTASPAVAQGPKGAVKGQPLKELMSTGGFAALSHLRAMRATGRRAAVAEDEEEEGDEGRVIPSDNVAAAERGEDQAPFGSGRGRSGGAGRNKDFRNAFVNDPCLDPAPNDEFPNNFFNTVQSETEIAVLNSVRDDHGGGRLMVAGYNDSRGFEDNRQGLSGFSYSTDGGRQWIDASGLPPRVPSGAPSGTPGSDAYFGDPVVQVHHQTETFYYASIYLSETGGSTMSVNRGSFKRAPQQVPVESKANTRCAGHANRHGIPDPKKQPTGVKERIIWEPPVEAVAPAAGPDDVIGTADDDFLDKEWLYVDQNTGFLYLTYTRFTSAGETPLEMVRSFDGGHTWTPPTVIVPNLLDTFNQATQPVVTPTGRVIVSWIARTFPAPAFDERENRIEVALSDNCSTLAGACTFGSPVIVAFVNPQGEPPGYNRERDQILNAPFIMVDKGRDDGKFTKAEQKRSGFGNVYLTYFDGRTALAQAPAPPTTVFDRSADIHFSRSTTNGATWGPEVKVNDDDTENFPNSHVFPSVQVNQKGLIFITWLDRRFDAARNLLTDTFGDVSGNRGVSFDGDVRISDVSADWIVRADARPNFGDYNSSEVINFTDFVSIWADGRFPTPAPLTCDDDGCSRPADQAATPDSFFEIFGDGAGHHGD